MDVKKNEEMEQIVIPDGHFCGGNCSDCVHYNYHDRQSDGRCLCDYYNSYYYPSERNGCFNHHREY